MCPRVVVGLQSPHLSDTGARLVPKGSEWPSDPHPSGVEEKKDLDDDWEPARSSARSEEAKANARPENEVTVSAARQSSLAVPVVDPDVLPTLRKWFPRAAHKDNKGAINPAATLQYELRRNLRMLAVHRK